MHETGKTDFQTFNYGGGVYRIDAPPAHFQTYLIVGETRAALIDTGLGFGSLKKEVRKITNLPIVVINTHGHPDHCGGNAEFEDCRINLVDLRMFAEKCGHNKRLEELERMGIEDPGSVLQPTAEEPSAIFDGEVVDLGSRTIEILFVPGHTRGSIAVYDGQTGSVFAGDNVMGEATALIEQASAQVMTYWNSLVKILALRPKHVYSGHSPGEVPTEKLPALIHCCERILLGERGQYLETPRGSGNVVSAEGASIHFTPEKTH